MSAVKQCAYLLSAPSQVIQGSLKFCQCWLRADQSTDGPESPFLKRHRKRAVLPKAKGWCSPISTLPTQQRDLGRAQLLTKNTLSSTQTLISSVSHRENIRSSGSCWTTQRSILDMEMTNSGLSVSLFLGTPYCTTSSQVTTQPLP